MTRPDVHKDALPGLEALVDTCGMENVLHALAAIASEKADHIQTNWQDDRTARVWYMAHVRIEACASAMPIRRISQ